MAQSVYEALYKGPMNINEDGCRPWGMASALMVIGVSAWYPGTYNEHLVIAGSFFCIFLLVVSGIQRTLNGSVINNSTINYLSSDYFRDSVGSRNSGLEGFVKVGSVSRRPGYQGARFIRTVCMHRIRWSCEGLTSVHNEYTGYTLKYLLLRHMYNLSLPALLCYAQALRSETSYCYCYCCSSELLLLMTPR